MVYREFSIISRYFKQMKGSRFDVETGIGDDCALLNVPRGKILAVSTDTLVCDRHFLPDINPDDLAYKALAVNVSDLAAMGADPAWITLALTLPKIDEAWIKTFSDMLFDQLNYYNMQLIGGDTTSGPLSITITIHGFIPKGHATKRSGAKPGDWMYVTGTLGDSAAGLAILQNRLVIENINDSSYFKKRHLRPIPRIFYKKILRKYASSAIDLSDGLLSDLDQIVKASRVGARVNLDVLPLSAIMQMYIDTEQALCWAISGGEDYELLFTVPNLYRDKISNLSSESLGAPFTCIGQILPESEGLQFMKNNIPVTIKCKGYDHFT